MALAEATARGEAFVLRVTIFKPEAESEISMTCFKTYSDTESKNRKKRSDKPWSWPTQSICKNAGYEGFPRILRYNDMSLANEKR